MRRSYRATHTLRPATTKQGDQPHPNTPAIGGLLLVTIVPARNREKETIVYRTVRGKNVRVT